MFTSHFSASAVTAAAILSTFANGLPTSLVSKVKRGDSLKFNFGSEKIRGVNTGGWFVLEPWITPSIFEATPSNVVDEYTFCQTLGKTEAESRLQQHWSTWITESDFAEMASIGLNFVRIPIGYWSVSPLPGDPYVQGAYEYLGEALNWAQSNNLMVMIDLHGAPGSQNGFDNSGRRGPIDWTQGNTIAQTHTALNKIRDDYASHPAVAAIELVNEPLGPDLDMDTVRQFYMDGWGDLEDSHVAITFHDAFEGVNSWNDWGSGMWALMEDTHHYEVFDSGQYEGPVRFKTTVDNFLMAPGSLQMSLSEHISTACSFGASMATNNKWTVAGEWTGAMTDCAQWLNGRGVGARYDGTYNYNGESSSYIGSCDGKYSGTVAGLSQADHNNIKSFINAQMQAFEDAAGWIFWCWKNEAAPEWHFQNLTAAGMVPQPLSSANGCSS